MRRARREGMGLGRGPGRPAQNAWDHESSTLSLAGCPPRPDLLHGEVKDVCVPRKGCWRDLNTRAGPRQNVEWQGRRGPALGANPQLRGWVSAVRVTFPPLPEPSCKGGTAAVGAGQHPGVRGCPRRGWARREPPAHPLLLLGCSSGWTWKSWRKSRRTPVSATAVSAGLLVSKPPPRSRCLGGGVQPRSFATTGLGGT